MYSIVTVIASTDRGVKGSIYQMYSDRVKDGGMNNG